MTDNIRVFHEKAMEYADMAFIAKRVGDAIEATRLFQLAFEHEKAAANLLLHTDVEPTRSVLYRSAATLALDCGEYQDAEKLIATALAGNPPVEIAEELRDLFEQVNFYRHLSVRGESLNPGEIQLSLTGSAIGFGMALTDVVIHRITQLDKLIQRTVERLLQKPFRERGAARKSLIESYSLYMSTPRAGSFSLTFRLGQQQQLPGFDDTGSIIDDVLDNLRLINEHEYELLKERIPDQVYYRNFVGIAKEIAPDGEKVTAVGFTSLRDGKEVGFSLTTPKKNVQGVVKEEESPDEITSEQVEVTGILRYADSTEEKRQEIRLVDDRGDRHRIVVPEGLMTDIVKPLWADRVVVRGPRRSDGRILLEDIEPAADVSD